jgi:hypothetical protein
VTGFPRSPRLVKGGIVLVDSSTAAVRRIVTLQYNPDTLSRTIQVQGAGDGGERSEALRLKGPAIETIKLDVEIDATDHLEFPDQHASAVTLGIHPQLAALEAIVQPAAGDLATNALLASVGLVEILPMETSLTLFVWSAQRILPVRITELSVLEEAFDVALNPIRARVSLGMRVLSVDDLGFAHKGGAVFMAYLRAKERLVGSSPPAALSNLGLGGLP